MHHRVLFGTPDEVDERRQKTSGTHCACQFRGLPRRRSEARVSVENKTMLQMYNWYHIIKLRCFNWNRGVSDSAEWRERVHARWGMRNVQSLGLGISQTHPFVLLSGGNSRFCTFYNWMLFKWTLNESLCWKHHTIIDIIITSHYECTFWACACVFCASVVFHPHHTFCDATPPKRLAIHIYVRTSVHNPFVCASFCGFVACVVVKCTRIWRVGILFVHTGKHACMLYVRYMSIVCRVCMCVGVP